MGESCEKLSEFSAARSHLERALELAKEHVELVSAALSLLSRVMISCGDLEEAQRLAEQGLALARDAGIPAVIRNALVALGCARFFRGHYLGAAACAEEARDLAEEAADHYDMARALILMGNAALARSDLDAAARHYGDAMKEAEEVGASYQRSMCEGNLGDVYLRQGRFEAALRSFEMDLDFVSKVGDRAGVALDLVNVAHAHHGLGNAEAALHHFEKAFEEALAVGASWVALSALAGKAGIIGERGDLLEAARLLGLAPRHPMSNAEVARDAQPALDFVRTRLPPDVLEEAMQRGAKLSLRDVR